MTLSIKGGGEPNLATAMGVGPQSHFTVIKGGKVEKADAEVLAGSEIEKDDAFADNYFDPSKQQNDTTILRPPYNPKNLSQLTQKNNTLGQLVTAMETNIDGTGWVIEKKDQSEVEDGEEDAEVDRITDFFDEVYPRVSFTTVRRALRRDLEKVGYGFLEVLRSVEGKLIFLKHIDADQIRLVKLDEAVPVETIVQRDGNDFEIIMNMRERRFAQIQGKKLVYFKEYGSTRELNKMDGMWVAEGETVEVVDRATELLFFMVNEDALTPYGVPRWINQVPSVLGSRLAEELNLDFFYSGGLPPALIFIQGGELTSEVRKQLQQYLTGKGASVHRAGVVEVAASGGSIDSPGSVRVTVERFGSERMQDSMFENYDARCEERVRGAFRLPPILMGKSQDYSFATAFASYTVAEAQVFVPERMEFDEIINNTIMRELDESGEYVFRSMPLTVHDVATQLTALGLVKDVLSSETLIETVNEITSLKLKALDPEDPEHPNAIAAAEADKKREALAALPAPAAAGVEPVPGGPPQPVEAPAVKMDTFEMMGMVQKYCDWQLTGEGDVFDIEMIRSVVKRMDETARARFDGYCTMRMMSAMDHDMVGAVELVGAAVDMEECEHGSSS